MSEEFLGCSRCCVLFHLGDKFWQLHGWCGNNRKSYIPYDIRIPYTTEPRFQLVPKSTTFAAIISETGKDNRDFEFGRY